MHNILIFGAGKIGSLIACLLAESADYQVILADMNLDGADCKRVLKALPEISAQQLDINDADAIAKVVKQHTIHSVISCLPYFHTLKVAKIAGQHNLSYFDLTEDTASTTHVQKIAQSSAQAFVPQCGLAPGAISIIANSLMQHFDSLDSVKMRVGALPQHTNNALQYALNWSTDGLINEYGNPVYGIEEGKQVELRPLEGLERIQIDGLYYEAFNTSGGLGSLAKSYADKVKKINYKTIRYPGHCEKMRFLMNDLKLNSDRETLKRVLENVLPKTYQDVVIIYVAVTGMRKGELIEENYQKKVYAKTIAGLLWSAIQVTTASSVCAVVDTVMNNPTQYQGLILQEAFTLETFLNNRFGKYYA